MKRAIFSIIFLAILVVTAYAATSMVLPPSPKNPNHSFSSNDAGYNPQKGIGYLQAWGFWAKAENGSLIVAQFMVSNTGFQKSFPGYNVTVVPPGGKPVSTHQEFDAKDFSGAKDRLDVKMPNVLLSGTHPSWKIKLDDPDIQLDLNLKAHCPGLKMGGDGRIHFGKNNEDFFRLVMLAPKATITGSIGVKGKTYPFNGWGYADQILQNVLSTSFSKKWFSLRFFNNDLCVAHTGFVPKDSYSPHYAGFTAVIKGGEIKYATSGGSIKALGTKPDPVTNKAIPTKAVFQISEPGCKLAITVPYGDYFERMEVLDRLNAVTRKIVGTFFARPVFYRTLADTTAKVDLGAGEKSYKGEVIGQFISMK